MDLFWLIPLVIIVIPGMVVFYAYIRSRPLTPSDPNVLLDNPSEESPTKAVEEAHDWQGRPCGSFLDWHYGRSK
jgi:hypothetical protein